MKRKIVTALVAGSTLSAASAAQGAFAVRLVGLNPATTTANAGGGTNTATVENIEEGEALLAGTAGFAIRATATASPAVINYARGGSGDFSGSESNFPDISGGAVDQEQFGFEALGKFTYNTAGSYVFRVNSDDGFRLRTGVSTTGAGGTTISEFVAPRGPANTDSPAQVRLAGATDNVRLTFFELGGGEEVEFSYSLNGGAFQLVGSTADITVTDIPEPASAGLLSLGGLALLVRRRRPAR